MTTVLHHFGAFGFGQVHAGGRSPRRLFPGLDFSVSYTTRPPRGSEQNGREYYFVTREEFEKMIAENEFLEYAKVFGNYYGTARRFLREAEQKGHDLLLDIDVQGAEQIKRKLPEAVSIFILPPDRKTWSSDCATAAQDPGRCDPNAVGHGLPRD